jgi:hypothetical protein
MGAICWQVVHQNSKNSTNCSPPDAMLTVVGSVASRFGPREVATRRGVGRRLEVGITAVAVVSGVDVGGCAVSVAYPSGTCVAGTVGVAGAHPAVSTASRIRTGKSGEFICFFMLSRIFSPVVAQIPYASINGSPSFDPQTLIFDGSKILRYTRLSLSDIWSGS